MVFPMRLACLMESSFCYPALRIVPRREVFIPFIRVREGPVGSFYLHYARVCCFS
jgi:hypothetical protein